MSWERISINTVVTEIVAKKVRTTAGDSLYFHRKFVDKVFTKYWFGASKGECNYKNHYQYATPELFKIIRQKPIGSMTEEDHKIMWEDLSLPIPDVFDSLRICKLDTGNDLIFQYGKEAPISSVRGFDYIGGIANNYFEVKKACEHLKSHPNVLKCKIEDIPYYNSADNYTKGLRMSILLPQEKLDAMWEFYKNEKYPFVRFKEAIIPTSKTSPFDPLDIKQFLIDESN